MNEPILWPQPDGTSRTVEAGDIRALVGYVEEQDIPTGDELVKAKDEARARDGIAGRTFVPADS